MQKLKKTWYANFTMKKLNESFIQIFGKLLQK